MNDAWYDSVEERLAELRSRGDYQVSRPAQTRQSQQVRLAMTVPPPTSSGSGSSSSGSSSGESAAYPLREDEPNTYWIVFLDGSFPKDSQGNLSASFTVRQRLENALTTAHCIDEGPDAWRECWSVILVTFANGQWWFGGGGTPVDSSSSGSGSSSGDSGSGDSSSGDSSSGDSSSGDSSSGDSSSGDSSSGASSGDSGSGDSGSSSNGGATASVTVVTDVYCDDGDIVVCTRTLTFINGLFVAASAESCGDEDSSSG